MVAIVMLSVVLDRAIHLYLSDCPSDVPSSGCRLEIKPTLVQLTARSLLDHNYLPAEPAGKQDIQGGASRATAAERVPLNPRDTHDLNY
jgi:hypothetical protein